MIWIKSIALGILLTIFAMASSVFFESFDLVHFPSSLEGVMNISLLVWIVAAFILFPLKTIAINVEEGNLSYFSKYVIIMAPAYLGVWAGMALDNLGFAILGLFMGSIFLFYDFLVRRGKEKLTQGK